MNASYWLCVLLIGQDIFFILLRRHIFVFFTGMLSFCLSSPLCCQLAYWYLIAHIVGNGYTLAMTPNLLQIGQELRGTSNAFATAADFTYNQYVNASNNTRHYQFVDGIYDEYAGSYQHPPDGGWYSANGAPHLSSTGGDFQAWTN